MFVRVKSHAELDAMRESGRMLATVLDRLKPEVVAGVTTKQLSDMAAREAKALGGKTPFLNYFGFPEVICISLNDEVVHGIPKKDRVIADGDLVSLDFGISYKGMITDSAITIIAGTPRKASHVKLLEITEQSLVAGISAAHGGCRTGDIAAAVQAVLQPANYGIVRDLVGHGVGDEVHEEPNVPNYGRKNTGERLKTGHTIAIEPMATLGGYDVMIMPDGWTVKTRDGSLSAHFEHTVALTDDGAVVMTEL